jgi:hypothetical protein
MLIVGDVRPWSPSRDFIMKQSGAALDDVGARFLPLRSDGKQRAVWLEQLDLAVNVLSSQVCQWLSDAQSEYLYY